jgi:hypothetical protein
MALKKSEIAAKVFDVVDAMAMAPVSGGPLDLRVSDVPAVALVPWFCEASVQWALRMSAPSGPLKKNVLAKVSNTYVAVVDGRLIIGVPGDGIEPPTYTLKPLADAVAAAAVPGSTLELAAANLGVVKRDWEVKAETRSANGNHHYVGTIGPDGGWTIERSFPALTAAQLETAIDCGRKFVTLGPWDVKDKPEAEAILKQWLSSAQANINPMAVKQLWTLKGLRFEDAGTDEQRRRMGGGLDRKLYGLALGYFRHRLAGGPFQWNEPPAYGYSEAVFEDVRRAVVQ